MKTLNPKSEILNKSQILNSKLQTAKLVSVWNIGTLEFRVCLEFRYSDLEFERNGVSL